MKNYRVIIADNHRLIRKGINKLLAKVPYIKVVCEVKDDSELSEFLKKSTPDLVMLNIKMPPNGIENALKIKENFQQIKILFYTICDDREYLHQALSIGAEGFMLGEDFDTQLEKAINTIREGNVYISPALNNHLVDLMIKKYHGDLDKESAKPSISPREIEIIKLVAEGNTSRQIAHKLFISVRTVHRHRDNIMKKLGTKRTTDLIKYAIKNDIYKFIIEPKRFGVEEKLSDK